MLQIEVVKPEMKSKTDYFHPSVAPLPGGKWLMCMQELAGSDHYGSPEYSISSGLGNGWSTPSVIASLESRTLSSELTEGVADVRLFALPGSSRVLAIGCTTFYTPRGALSWDKKALSNLQAPLRQVPVYSIYEPSHGWSPMHKLATPSMDSCKNWRVACAQLAFTPEGHILLPVYFETGRVEYYGWDSPQFSVCVLQAILDGDELVVENSSNVLSHSVLRGFCEPSLYYFNGEYFLTIRAEDGRGYWSRNTNPMAFPEPRPWSFSDGELLNMSSTQQHWLELAGKLYLVYTRDTGDNSMVTRFRAPLLIARFNPDSGTLERNSEQVVLPHEIRDGADGLLGNFHCLALEDGTGIVTDAPAFLKINEGNIVARHSEIWLAKLKEKDAQ
ncbi:MAG: hypothetical protein GX937_03645 [Lentisphaerae bacterium]|jgi:hypothetical protein|nr:hypothetical protein [Lentisphaerota bacterium]